MSTVGLWSWVGYGSACSYLCSLRRWVRCSDSRTPCHHTPHTAPPVPSAAGKSGGILAVSVLGIHHHRRGEPWMGVWLTHSCCRCTGCRCTGSPAHTGCTGTEVAVTVALEEELELLSIGSKAQSGNRCLAGGSWCAPVWHLDTEEIGNYITWRISQHQLLESCKMFYRLNI